MKYHISFDIEFNRNESKGVYVAIEGIDGSGKSTQVERLKEYFEKKNASVVTTSEPRSDSVVGKILRDVLQAKIKIPSSALQYLYSADRVINQETIVKPALEKGALLLSHRSFWSVIPYGVMDKGLVNYSETNAQILAVAQGLLSMYHQFIAPDHTFYLDILVDTAMRRLSAMDKVKEIYEKKEKLTQIREGYLWQMKLFPSMFTVINGEQDEEKVTKEIIGIIEKKL